MRSEALEDIVTMLRAQAAERGDLENDRRRVARGLRRPRSAAP